MEEQPLKTMRERARGELNRLHPGVRRFMNAHAYPVGIEAGLHTLRHGMIEKMRANHGTK